MSLVSWQPRPRRRTFRGVCLTIAGAAWCAGVFACATNGALNLAVDLAIIGACGMALVAFFARLRSWRV